MSPKEVQEAIEEEKNVDEAHVFTISHPRVYGVICAFVKLKPGAQCGVDQLKHFLGDTSSAYRIPEHIHFVDEFPRTSLGKVVKHKLAEERMNILTL